VLPPDVAVRGLCEAPSEFHARHSARTKTYVYTILNRDLRRPLERHYSWHLPQGLDVQSMRTASKFLVGTHDFAAFGLLTDGTPSTVRRILVASVESCQGGFLKFSIRGTGFLRYMVRSIVGTLALVGRNKMTPLEFKAILESRQRSRSGPVAPAQGLRLELVEYGPEIDALLKASVWRS
jgi:tRNA pseudouridine38-40 synthase